MLLELWSDGTYDSRMDIFEIRDYTSGSHLLEISGYSEREKRIPVDINKEQVKLLAGAILNHIGEFKDYDLDYLHNFDLKNSLGALESYLVIHHHIPHNIYGEANAITISFRCNMFLYHVTLKKEKLRTLLRVLLDFLSRELKRDS